jgi:hypothetical protein
VHDVHDFVVPDPYNEDLPALCCDLHPEADTYRYTSPSKPRTEAAPTPPAPQEESLPTLADIRQYLIAENTALKLELASLRCLVTEILKELRKPTPTAPQPVVRQEPKTVMAPPCQQQTEKRKRTTSGSPTPRAPKAVRAVSPDPPSLPPAASINDDTDMQLVLAAEADTAAVASSVAQETQVFGEEGGGRAG